MATIIKSTSYVYLSEYGLLPIQDLPLLFLLLLFGNGLPPNILFSFQCQSPSFSFSFFDPFPLLLLLLSVPCLLDNLPVLFQLELKPQ